MPQQFARLDNGVVVEVVTVPDGLTLDRMLPAQLAAAMIDVTGLSIADGMVRQADGSFAMPPPPVLPLTAAQLAALAQAGLDRSDMAALRCLKAGIAFPAEWQTYVATLRAIVAGTRPGPLPAQPAYPAGT